MDATSQANTGQAGVDRRGRRPTAVVADDA